MTEDIRSKAALVISEKCKSGFRHQDIEKSVYNWAVDFCSGNCLTNLEDFEFVYNDKFQEVMINLEHLENNEGVQNNVASIKGGDLAYLQPYDWNPDCWKATLSEKLRRDTTSSGVEQSITDLFKCGKCKLRKTSYYEMQIRSADESATIFITCLNPRCKNEWRIG